ncbi:hypothetical protein Glove_482g47 [Diversispora epigaea]|uniref:Uncharacterized protein n=1 Tax=Diversispora epigaea TaxID=1348612 RepID=A0A397GLQ3_9GLOM|nr:hypothetical protein Glove_482g47 [Diversispora epigaea]
MAKRSISLGSKRSDDDDEVDSATAQQQQKLSLPSKTATNTGQMNKNQNPIDGANMHKSNILFVKIYKSEIPIHKLEKINCLYLMNLSKLAINRDPIQIKILKVENDSSELKLRLKF